MNYEYILREIKLSKLTDTPMSEEASRLVKFWDELWTDMKVKIDPIKGEIKCWKDDHDCYYFRQDDKNDRFWCNYNKVWSFFSEKIELNYTEIQELIQYMVSKTLNCKVNTPLKEIEHKGYMVNKTLNCKVNTPTYHWKEKIVKGG